MTNQNYIWQVNINKQFSYYFSSETKALNAIKRSGKILKHNCVNRNKQKIVLIDDLGFKLEITLSKLKLD